MGSSQATQPMRCDVLELGAPTTIDSTIGRSCDFIQRKYLESPIGEPVTADDVNACFDRIPRFAHTTPNGNLTLKR